MKKTTVILALICCSTFNVFAVLEKYYTFDNTYNGATPYGDPTFVPGIIGQCVDLDGNDAIDTNLHGLVNDYTIAMWLFIRSTGNQCFVGKHYDDGTNRLLFGYWDNKITYQILDEKHAEGSLPPLGIWHHLAITVEDRASRGSVKYYLDGQLQWGPVFIEEDPTSRTGKPWTIGQDWDDKLIGGPERSDFFKGMIDDLRFYENQRLSDGEIYNLFALPFRSKDPSPEHESTDIPVNTQLAWTIGYSIFNNNIYLDTVNPPKNVVYSGRTINSFDPGILESGRTYYWQIESTSLQYGTFKSSVWKFTTKDHKASNPTPENNTSVYTPTFNLQWTLGPEVLSHDIYLDTVNPPLNKIADDHTESSLPVGLLEIGRPYYWQVISNTAVTSVPGPVWSLTVDQYHLETGPYTTGTGTVTIDPPGGEYWLDTEVTLTANPSPGFKFETWNGDIDTAENPTAVIMDSDKDIKAVFAVLDSIITVDDDGPADFAKIQDAIDSSIDGHIIQVAPGTYDENLDLKGKSITLTSTDPHDPDTIAQTIITASSGYALTCQSGETTDTIITGFTFKECNNTPAVLCQDAGPAIAWCHFLNNNHPNSSGGAIFLDQSNAVISHCIINGNTAANGSGIYCQASNPIITHCIFSGNNSTSEGILFIHDSYPTVTNCAFAQNVSVTGGAVCILDCKIGPSVITCAFEDNAPVDISMLYCPEPKIQYNCLEAGFEGTGNIAARPQFINPAGPDLIPGTIDDDLRLDPDSPCIDAGDSTALPKDYADVDGDGIINEIIPLDLDLNPRLANVTSVPDTGVYLISGMPTVDIGPYESAGSILVQGDLDGDGDVDIADFAIFTSSWMIGVK